jgi:hypothetical protein
MPAPVGWSDWFADGLYPTRSGAPVKENPPSALALVSEYGINRPAPAHVCPWPAQVPKHLWPKSPSRPGLNNLAVVLADAGRRGEAEPLYRRAVQMLNRIALATGTPPGWGVILQNYRICLTHQGLSAEAIDRRLADELTSGSKR